MTDPLHAPRPDDRPPAGPARPAPPGHRQPTAYPAFTRRILLVMALFALALKFVNYSLHAMMVPAGAVQLITSLLLLAGLGYLVAFYFRRGPFRPDPPEP